MNNQFTVSNQRQNIFTKDEIKLFDLYQLFLKRWKFFLVFFLLCLLSGIIYVMFFMAPIYDYSKIIIMGHYFSKGKEKYLRPINQRVQLMHSLYLPRVIRRYNVKKNTAFSADDINIKVVNLSDDYLKLSVKNRKENIGVYDSFLNAALQEMQAQDKKKIKEKKKVLSLEIDKDQQELAYFKKVYVKRLQKQTGKIKRTGNLERIFQRIFSQITDKNLKALYVFDNNRSNLIDSINAVIIDREYQVRLLTREKNSFSISEFSPQFSLMKRVGVPKRNIVVMSAIAGVFLGAIMLFLIELIERIRQE